MVHSFRIYVWIGILIRRRIVQPASPFRHQHIDSNDKADHGAVDIRDDIAEQKHRRRETEYADDYIFLHAVHMPVL